MKKSELISMRNQVNSEIEKRKRINEYLEKEDVIGYLNEIGECTDKRDLENIREMLINILENFPVKKTNGIYVCIKAFDRDSHSPVLYFNKPVDKYESDFKGYMDIESKEEIITDWVYGPSIDSFERSHIVLNPYNTQFNDRSIKANGYDEVRLDFFEECYKHGQNSAVKLVLSKYPRIGSYR